MWKQRLCIAALAGAWVAASIAAALPLAGATTGDVTVQGATPVVGVATTPTGQGYWEVAADGGIFAFGNAQYFGSMGGAPLDRPIVAIAATPDGRGYWEVAADGGIFAFGDAQYFGSMGGAPLDRPIVGIAATPDGRGYWEVATDGGIFAFGDAQYFGSMGGAPLDRPISGMAATATGRGYWEVASDGGIFSFGSAGFAGSMGGQDVAASVVGMAADAAGSGYWEVGATGAVYAFGAAPFQGAMLTRGTTGATIAAIASGQVGSTDPYAYGPAGGTWCGYFTSWVWGRAGVPIPPTGPAAGIGTWALGAGGTVLPPSATPAVGDAVLWVGAGTADLWPDAAALNYPHIEHVNIVTQVLPGGGIVTVGGNESGSVRRIGPYAPSVAASYFGQTIFGYVQPPA